jgi:hypothetical protein
MGFAPIIINDNSVLLGEIATLIACSCSGRPNYRTSKNSEEQVTEKLFGVAALRCSVAGNVLHSAIGKIPGENRLGERGA